MEILGIHDVLRVDHGNREPVVRRVCAAIVGIVVLDYLADVLWKILHWPRNLNRKQVFAPPCLNSRPSAEDFEEAIVVRDMCSNRYPVLLANLLEDRDE